MGVVSISSPSLYTHTENQVLGLGFKHTFIRAAFAAGSVFGVIIYIASSIMLSTSAKRTSAFHTALYRVSDSSQSPKLFLRADPEGIVLDDLQAYRSNLLIRRGHDPQVLQTRPVTLDINKSDVMVMLHIQKTGGTAFENRLVENTNVLPRCRCETMYAERNKCYCRNSKGQDWLFNRHAVGWACGVHADFTELTSCVDPWYMAQSNEHRHRKYHYITLLRDPVNRFVSEWQHVRRGATWKESRLHCGGRDATLEEVPFCFRNGNWSMAHLEEFLKCPYNMAINRQTRMLANLSLSDCYRIDSTKTRRERDEIMLQSAKENLRKFFEFFGLLEYSSESQALFEKTFPGFEFTKNLFPRRGSLGMNYVMLSESSWNRIIDLNSLDVRLYQYAKDLFIQRLKRAKILLEPQMHESKYVAEGFTFTTVEI